MGLSSNCCHSNIGNVSAEQRSLGAKVSGAEPTPSPPPPQSLPRPPWHEAVVRGRGTQAGHRHAAGPARSHSEPAASTKEARQQGERSSTTGTPTEPARRKAAPAPQRATTPRDDTDVTSVRARTSSTHAPQRRVAGPTRPNRARGLFWCALSRRGASEGHIGAVVVFVWVASAGAGWV